MSRFVLILSLAMIGIFIRLAIAWQPWDWLIRTGTFGDDACYYAALAFNISNGNGPTTDGIHMTNGFQPLWAFMLVPIYSLGASKEKAINIAMTILALLSASTGVVLFFLARQLWGENVALWTALFWMTSPTVLRQSLNGMETGLYAFMLSIASLAVVAWTSRERPRLRVLESIAIGVLCGLVVLSRVDGLPFAISAIMACWHSWAREERSGNVGQATSLSSPEVHGHACSRLATMRTIIAIFAFILVLIPWLSYSVATVGKLFPESGDAVRWLSLAYIGAADDGITWRAICHSVTQAASALLRLQQWNFIRLRLIETFGGIASPLIAIAVLLLSMVLFIWLIRIGYIHEAVMMLRNLFRLWFWILHAIAIVLAYSLYQFGWWFFPRYFFAITPLGIITGAVLVEALRISLKKFQQGKALLSNIAAITVILIQLAQLYLGWCYLHSRTAGGFEEYLNVALWLREHTQVGVRIGMFQSGTASYLSERTVINLDGVVNGEALKAMVDRRVLNYVASQGITYIADWDELIQLLLIERSGREELSRWKLVRIRSGEMSVYKLVKATGRKR